MRLLRFAARGSLGRLDIDGLIVHTLKRRHPLVEQLQGSRRREFSQNYRGLLGARRCESTSAHCLDLLQLQQKRTVRKDQASRWWVCKCQVYATPISESYGYSAWIASY